MALFVDLPGSLNRQRASQTVGFAAVAIAAAALIGWWAGLPVLARWGSGYSAMGPVAALLLAAFGLALVHPGKDSRFAFAVGLAGIAGAAVGLVLLLFNMALRAPSAGSFRVTSAGTLAFGLAAGALALGRFERRRLAATVLASLVGGITAFALLGYLSGVDTLYGSASVNSPSLPAAVGLLCVAIGIILRIGTMPMLRRSRPLWHLLVMLGFAIVAPLLSFIAYAAFHIADAQLDDVREDLTMEARTLSAGVDEEIVGEIERLQALATSPSLRQGDFAEFQRQAEASLALRQSGNIVLIDRNMQQRVDTAVPFGKFLPKSNVPEAVEKAMATGKPQVTGLFTARAVNRLSFGIIVPVQIDGERRYVLGRSPDRRALARVVSANKLPTGWQAVVSDTTHHIIARSDQPDPLVGQELSPPQWHGSGPDSVFKFVDPEGRLSQEAYARSELTGWETAVWAPEALLVKPVRTLWATIGTLALLAVALTIASSLWLGRIIARSVGIAAQAAVVSDNGGPLLPSRTPVAEVNAMMAELREITDLLRQSEATFRAMFDFSSVAKVESAYETGRFLRANAAMCKFMGYSEAELLARTVFDITHPDERERDQALLRRMVAGQLPVFDMEKRYIRKDGRVVWARTTANVVRDASGRPLRYTVVIQDIGARKQAEHDLQASKDRLQLALNAAVLGWWQYDPVRRVIVGDTRLKEIFDFAADKTPLEEFVKRVHPDDLERVLADRKAALNPADPKPYAHEYRIWRRDGEVRWVDSHGLAYFEGAGRERRAVSFIGTVADITQRKQHEELVQRQADLLDQSHDAILTLQPGGRGIVYWSRGAERLYGYTAAEAEGRRTHELLQTRAPIPIEDIDTQVVYGGSWNGELTHTTRDGREIVVESRIVRVSYNGETFALETNRDITERKQREEREHLLMREVNHRAKNILSVVDAIARQTAARTPEDFVERFSERIQALSANQELLVRNEWRGVEIEDLVRAQLSHFADLVGSRVVVHGPKLCLKAASAQAIGLALHELATNAGKYGALSKVAGRLDIHWGTDGDTFAMSWAEHDGPPVSPPQRRGFGTIVMERMTECSVGGSVDLDYAPSGVTWRLTCPTANALDPSGT